MSLVSGNSQENFGPVVMEMTSAKPKIRHVFGFTCLTERKIGALSPVILYLSGSYQIVIRIQSLKEFCLLFTVTFIILIINVVSYW